MDAMTRAARLCPVCGGESHVFKSFEREDGLFLRRRRCKSCGMVFETIEVFTGLVRGHRRPSKPQKEQKGLPENKITDWTFTADRKPQKG